MNRWPLSKMRQYLHYHGDVLNDRELFVLWTWYGVHPRSTRWSYQKIGVILAVTPSRVSQIRKVAEWKLEREQEMWEEDARNLGVVHRRYMLQALLSALELETKTSS